MVKNRYRSLLRKRSNQKTKASKQRKYKKAKKSCFAKMKKEDEYFLNPFES